MIAYPPNQTKREPGRRTQNTSGMIEDRETSSYDNHKDETKKLEM
jgi:hypothetical protein